MFQKISAITARECHERAAACAERAMQASNLGDTWRELEQCWLRRAEDDELSERLSLLLMCAEPRGEG